jgi:aldehyde:ferredoxin oxidoreductase
MSKYGMYGWTGKILQVDLSTGIISILQTSNYVPKYLGGRGLAARLHWEMVGPDVKGTDPENVITFATSAQMGTPSPGGAKTIVTAVSPHTYPVQTYYKSGFGGHWGPELKFAGWDALVIKGASSKPVYILIEDENVEIRDAGNLWGRDAYAVQQEIWERHSYKHRMALIGPAGENLGGDSIIITDDSNTCGKGAFGAVLGSKKLKGIVVRGTGGVAMADPQGVLDTAYYAQRLVTRKETEVTSKVFSHPWRKQRYGPGGACEGTDLWNEGENGTARIGMSGCFGCPIACGMSVKLMDGSEIGSGHHMCVEVYPDSKEMAYNNEYLGRMHYSRLKNQDRIGLSHWGWYMDIVPLLNYGFVPIEALGIPYEYGSIDFARELQRKITYREEGYGELLAEGVAHYLNEVVGTPEAISYYQMVAVTDGKFRLPYNYAAAFYGPVGWTGACVSHGRDNDMTWLVAAPVSDPRVVTQGSDEYYQFVDKFAKEVFGSEQAAIDSRNRVFGDYTAPMAKFAHDYKMFLDCMCSCTEFSMFYSSYTDDHMSDLSVHRKLFTAVTGVEIASAEEQYEYANRIWMLERAILTRQGRCKDDDWFFDFIFELDDYKNAGLTREALRKAIDHYYTLRGMDVDTGMPKRSTLVELGLEDVADDLVNVYGVSLPE